MEVLQLPTKSRHNRYVQAVYTPPDGQTVLVLTGSHYVASRLTTWNLAENRAVARLNVVTDPNDNSCWPHPLFSADFKVMTLGGFVKQVGKARRVSLGEGTPQPLAISPDGQSVYGWVNSVVPGPRRLVFRWDMAAAFAPGGEFTPATRLPYKHHRDFIAGAVSPDGSMLVALPSYGRRLYRWRLPGGDPLPTWMLSSKERASNMQLSPDGRTLAVFDSGLVLLDMDAGTVRRAIACTSAVGLAFTPDSARLVTAQHDGTAAVWDTATGKQVAQYKWRKLVGDLAAVAVFPDGLTAVAGGTRGRLVRWDLPA